MLLFFFVCPDHCSPGGDAEKRERAGRSPKETGSDQTAAVQVPAQRTTRGQQLIIQTGHHCCISGVRSTSVFVCEFVSFLMEHLDRYVAYCDFKYVATDLANQ